ncbi:hypothetical protein [Allomesorhizobium alhagi]|uniref:Uncharacterized protein n=1 Tax=Mesorhizobium alhagi CCNWXJ12-2 TaxID=1107882 RepID=H0HQC9_9HYPH|nr:hypothetical protein [Mesorhizobium alhagi]EHK57051.1 hypothetical protein MAXJ12_11797 [Mesorhizobium alhagi CCNWXJ12-2]
MKLLFKREQSSGTTGTVKFKLWGKIELEEQEEEIIRRYAFDKAVLIDAFQPELMRKSAYVGAAGFLAVVVLVNAAVGLSAAMFLALFAGAGAGYFYYDRKRDTVFVRDLMHGRYFSCDSVVELARKEAWLGNITAYLRQVMESAKHWGGTETVPIPVLAREDAKELIVRRQ